jgi:polysaccharide biosynthesis/export protein
MESGRYAAVVLAFAATCVGQGAAQTARPAQTPNTSGTVPSTPAVEVPPEYVIGPEDVLGVVFWRDTDMSGDVTVRPDGRITLPLVGDIHAAGLKPEGLRVEIQKAAAKFQQDPNVTIVVRQINSRKVFITGQVATPGAFPLTSPRTVMQLIALAGGLTEYADKKHITVMRVENEKQQVFPFNYSDVSKGKNVSQNILLKPGDTVIVP